MARRVRILRLRYCSDQNDKQLSTPKQQKTPPFAQVFLRTLGQFYSPCEF